MGNKSSRRNNEENEGSQGKNIHDSPRFLFLEEESERVKARIKSCEKNFKEYLNNNNNNNNNKKERFEGIDGIDIDLSRSGLKSLVFLIDYFDKNDVFSRVVCLDLSFNRIVNKNDEDDGHYHGKSVCDNDSVVLFPSVLELKLRCNHLNEMSQFVGLSSPFSLFDPTIVKKLDLTRNLINSLSFLKCFPVLEELYFGNNHLASCNELSYLSYCQELKVLNLSRCDIQSLFLDEKEEEGDVFFNKLNQLQVLLLEGNMFRSLPESIAIPSLKILSLVYDPVENIPVSIGTNCLELTELNLSRTLFRELPEEIGRLKFLVSLSLELNNMSSFPDFILSLASLKYLTISGTSIPSLPDELGHRLDSLESLVLRWNKLNSLPESVYSLKHLSSLDISGNGFSEISPSIGLLVSCASLNLSYNSLEELPPEILSLPLEVFGVEGNPFLQNEEMQMDYERLPPKNFLSKCFSPRDERIAAILPIPSPCQATDVKDAIMGLLFGAALGDAVGLSTEFMEKNQAKIHYGNDILTPITRIIDRHRSRWEPGDWTDDTDQMLLLTDNLISNRGQFNPIEFAHDLYRWAVEGFPELGDGGGLGLGATVSAVLREESFFESPWEASEAVWTRGGKIGAANGAVMRTAILGLINDRNDPDLVYSNTTAACRVTHADPRCISSCLVVTRCVALLLDAIKEGLSPDPGKIVTSAVHHTLEYTSDLLPSAHLEEFKKYCFLPTLKALELDERSSIGYTFKAMASAIWALQQNDFISAITRIVHEAGDADTNAVVAGALLGCRFGFSNLPRQWLDLLLHPNELQRRAELISELLSQGL